MEKSIENIEREIVEEFSIFPDWTEKYQYLIELGHDLKDFPEDKRTDEYKVKGCQSSVWVIAEKNNGSVIFKADSDSTIVKGLIALLLKVLSNRNPDEIINASLDFIDRIGLRQHLAPTRTNGLAAMVKQLKLYALAFKAKDAQRKQQK